MTVGLRRWREGKVRPIPGNRPHDRPVSRGILSSLKECLRRSLPRHCFPQLHGTILGAQYAFSKAWRNLSGPMGFPKQNQTLGWEPTASRWSAPSPGKRTRREDHAPSHRPQMSSDRLFLDRVARQHCPSPLHRHTQINMHSQKAQGKGDISTLLATRHFYFALTRRHPRLTQPAKSHTLSESSELQSGSGLLPCGINLVLPLSPSLAPRHTIKAGADCRTS